MVAVFGGAAGGGEDFPKLAFDVFVLLSRVLVFLDFFINVVQLRNDRLIISRRDCMTKSRRFDASGIVRPRATRTCRNWCDKRANPNTMCPALEAVFTLAEEFGTPLAVPKCNHHTRPLFPIQTAVTPRIRPGIWASKIRDTRFGVVPRLRTNATLISNALDAAGRLSRRGSAFL
jgi:hypothetical protein